MIDFESDLVQFWEGDAGRDIFFPDAGERSWAREDLPRVPLSREECPEERVEAAALSAWTGCANCGGIIAGEFAYDTVKELYFALHRRLFPHSKRGMFTKDECALLLDLLVARTVAGRGRRQPAQALNIQLKVALSCVTFFHIGCLQEAAKKCAVAVNGSPTGLMENAFKRKPRRQ
jgi:hypothetical protein